MKTAERVTQAILDALDKGVCPWKMEWRGGRPMSIDGYRYRGINSFLLSISDYDDNRWLTVHKANELGGNVKKGEHGQLVILWKKSQYTKENPETGEEEVHKGLLLRGYTVFNVEQCEGLPERFTKSTPTVGEPLAEANAIWEGYEDGPSLDYRGARAYYRPSTDEIVLPKPERFNTAEAFYSTLFHEAIHSTGIKARLSRPDFEKRDYESYGTEELVAEMGAAMLCAECGIQSTLENSAAYCKGWAEAIRQNPANMIIKVASQAQRAADYILGRREQPRDEE